MQTKEETKHNDILDIFDTATKSDLLMIDVEKARILIDEISQDFFDDNNPDVEDDLLYKIRFNFNRYKIKTDIFLDYFLEIEQKVNKINDELWNINNRLREVKQNGKATH